MFAKTFPDILFVVSDLKETFDLLDLPAAVMVTTPNAFLALLSFVFATAAFPFFPLVYLFLGEIFCFASLIDNAMLPLRSLSSMKVFQMSVIAKTIPALIRQTTIASDGFTSQ